ncbi:WYL domain-containing protein [Ornithobacterium rhinotracheale]|uniref:helix-turn-helix transcriptional regulator n=1 Tax=Ornithobacterium rhinotracheale TaxID=28251 RepID=UPI00129C5233|nr:WYL domain-containing protein [Ornithobacterium rhinotracheale]MRJ11238.1 WYL domain-containing protein [Ornithobacterium rhinotracheale]
MPINKNAIIRYQTLDRCFRNTGRRYNIDDLLEECNTALLELNPSSEGIKRRQLYDDIKFMESEQGYSIDLEKTKEGRKTYYRYTNPKFSINNQPLNDSESEQLKAALQILSRFNGAPQFEWLDEILPLLESKLGFIEQKAPVISFESNIDLKGIQQLTPLFNAIINQRVLNISYQDFQSEKPYNIYFHPYFLKQYNNRWFVLGLNEENGNPHWNLALDRIQDIKEIDHKYIKNTIDWEEYFYDVVGVTIPEGSKVVTIELKFTKNIAPYVITKPIHPSQKHKMIEDSLHVKIEVIPNIELERQILSFGEAVEVVSPLDFKNKISARVQKMAKLYGV